MSKQWFLEEAPPRVLGRIILWPLASKCNVNKKSLCFRVSQKILDVLPALGSFSLALPGPPVAWLETTAQWSATTFQAAALCKNPPWCGWCLICASVSRQGQSRASCTCRSRDLMSCGSFDASGFNYVGFGQRFSYKNKRTHRLAFTPVWRFSWQCKPSKC